MQNDYPMIVNTVGWALAGISTILVAARLYSRCIRMPNFGYDDGFMIFAYAFAVTTTALVYVGTRHGFGLHVTDILTPEASSEAIKYTLIPAGISFIASCAAKISILLFLVRLLGLAATQGHKIVLWVATLLMVAGNLFAVVVVVGFCNPARKSWRPETPGKCMSPVMLDIGTRTVTVYNAAMDLVCALFAISIIWKLSINTSTKRGLAVLTGGGLFGTAAGLVKVMIMGKVKDQTDMTYTWAPIAIWYMAEMHAMIICGSIPTLQPLWSKIQGTEYAGDVDSGPSEKRRRSGGKPPGSISFALGSLSRIERPKGGDEEQLNGEFHNADAEDTQRSRPPTRETEARTVTDQPVQLREQSRPSSPWRPPPANLPRNGGIRVTREVSVGWVRRSYGRL